MALASLIARRMIIANGSLHPFNFLSVISSMVVYLGRLGQQELNHLTFSKAKKVHIQYNIRKLYSAIS